jgi:hypothetical protein
MPLAQIRQDLTRDVEPSAAQHGNMLGPDGRGFNYFPGSPGSD